MAVGTHKGYVQIWDVAASKKISTLEGHSARVGKGLFYLLDLSYSCQFRAARQTLISDILYHLKILC